MSKLSDILQVYNDNLVCQMILWYFWAFYRDLPLMKVSVGWDNENSLKIVTISLKLGLLATMGVVCMLAWDTTVYIYTVYIYMNIFSMYT